MRPYIDAVYFLNLDDKIHRWKHYRRNVLPKLPDIPFIRIAALDTRTKVKAERELKRSGLVLIPSSAPGDIYFSRCPGAVGCMLSHIKIWRDVVDKGYKQVLVLEDDAHSADVLQFFSELDRVLGSFPSDAHLVQLNCRNPNNKAIAHMRKRFPELQANWETFRNDTRRMWGLLRNNDGIGPRFFNSHEGTESYFITLSGAETLISATENPSLLSSVNPVDHVFRKDLQKFFRARKPEPCWPDFPAITCAADKYLGYCYKVGLFEAYFYPYIRLKSQLVESDIIKGKPFWDLTLEEMEEEHNSINFEWWL